MQTKARLMSPIVLMLTLCCLLGIEGCASIPTGVRSTPAAHSNKIFLGNDTIRIRTLPGQASREFDRYTCGSEGMMQCEFAASVAECRCYAKGGFF